MNFDELYNIAKELSKEITLNDKSSYDNVAVTCLTDLYTGLCFKATCTVCFCAETSVIAQMLLKGETRITKLVAVYNGNEIISPCGKRREQIYQLDHNNLNCEILLQDKVMLLKDLLPEL